MSYQLTHSNMILRLSDELWISPDPGNPNYVAYLAWLDEGNTPLPAPELPAPTVLTAEQKLEAAGLTVDDLKELLGLS